MVVRLIAASLALLLTAGCAKVVVQRLPAGTGSEDAKLAANGVFYALPKTVARLTVKVERTKRTPALYAMFAPIFGSGIELLCKDINECRPKNGTVAETTAYAVKQGAAFSTFGEPDPDQVFMVKFSGGGAIDQKLSMTWNEAGLLSAASSEVTNRYVDITVSGLKMAASLGTKLAAGGDRGENEPSPTTCRLYNGHAGSENDEWVIGVLWRADRSAFALIDNYCAMSKEDRDKYLMGDVTLLDQALKAFVRRVVPLANARIALLTGGGQVLDPAALITRLDATIETETTTLFGGTKEVKTWDGTFELRDITAGATTILARVHPASGVCVEAMFLAHDSKALPKDFVPKASADCAAQEARPLQVVFKLYPEGPSQIFSRVAARVDLTEKGDRSFRYRIPAQVRATVSDGSSEFGEGVFSVAQLGSVVALPANRYSKSLSYELAMIEATGGLKTFKLGTSGGLDAGTIDSISSVGGTVVDARNAAAKKADDERKAAETAADELTVLTREGNLLKLKDQICEIQKKYGLACTVQP